MMITGRPSFEDRLIFMSWHGEREANRLWMHQFLFHDTESYATVRRAVTDIARLTGKSVYNFKESNGLGILV